MVFKRIIVSAREVIEMRSVFICALALGSLLALQPAMAQMTPNPVLAPGAANPAQAPGASNPAHAPGAAPTTPPVPAENGLCQCLHVAGRPPAERVNDVTLGLRCLSAVEECRSVCQTTTNYSFVPHAVLSCPGTPEETVGHVALNTRR
jgi:hypothetical protein